MWIKNKLVSIPLVLAVLSAIGSYLASFHYFHYVDNGIKCVASACVDVWRPMNVTDRVILAVALTMLNWAIIASIALTFYFTGRSSSKLQKVASN